MKYPHNLRLTPTRLPRLLLLGLIATATPAALYGEEVVPENSAHDRAAAEGKQILLLSPLDAGDIAGKDAYKMSNKQALPYDGVAAKVGQHAVELSADAEGGSSKGDYTLSVTPEGEIEELGMWVYLTPESNTRQVGFQVHDAEGEALYSLVDADWEGWKWVETNLQDGGYRPAYKQPDKNGKVDLPLKSVHIVWFAGGAGRSSVVVDALTAVSQHNADSPSFQLQLSSPPWGEPGDTFTGSLIVHNFTASPQTLTVHSSLQTNPQYQTPELPDPELGSDHAQGTKSWFVIGGERVDDNTLTDGLEDTCLQPVMPKEGYTELFEILDLGQVRPITAIDLKPGDGNWIRSVDIDVSTDGRNYKPVAELQNIDLYKNWKYVQVKLSSPVQARLLRIRHHDHGDNLPGLFRSLGSIRVYDGLADETIAIPTVGETVDEQTSKFVIPPHSFKMVSIKPSQPLGPNAYLFGVKYETEQGTKVKIGDYFVMPEGSVEIRPESRFGINTNSPHYIPQMTRVGFGWVRFENLKWPFYNPAPNDFGFDGSVGPWHVPFDEYFGEFHKAGLSILPYIFETPKWATSAPPDVKKNRKRYAPKNNEDYGKAVAQAVARYGSKKVSPDLLLTKDKKSGLGYITTFELWNEQNLTNKSWGFFVGPIEEFYELYRVGAEALKKINPDAVTSNGGWAGITMDWIDTMATYTYSDGKTPLDFTDVLSVHYYTGKQEPETATRDPNANRTGKGEANSKTIEQYLMELADWRDKLKPGMPIWVTEMGYDVGGPIGRTERHQAGKLPRSCMIALANGIEKVMIYRIAGSTPTHHGGAGLIRNDGSLRASYFTMATMIRQMDTVTTLRSHRLKTDDPRVWIYYWRTADGYMLTAHSYEDNVPLGINLGKCQVTNAFGAKSEQILNESFQLGPFPLYLRDIANEEVVQALLNQAIQRETERRKKMAFLSECNPYLFDFGSHEDVGKKKVGYIRPFTTVVKEDLYTPEKGFGFLEKVSGKNINAHWLKSLLDKDAVQMNKTTPFQVDVAPGTYIFECKSMKYRKNAEMTIHGAAEGDISVPLPIDNPSAITEPVTLTVKEGKPLVIDLPAAHFEWFTLIPQYQE